jgi:hypothetical protein
MSEEKLALLTLLAFTAFAFETAATIGEAISPVRKPIR